jgi:hypothetical protein
MMICFAHQPTCFCYDRDTEYLCGYDPGVTLPDETETDQVDT